MIMLTNLRVFRVTSIAKITERNIKKIVRQSTNVSALRQINTFIHSTDTVHSNIYK